MYKVNRFLISSSCCLIFFCNSIDSVRLKLPRYVVETDIKPAIFGSYSYDAIKGIFIIEDRNSSTTEINLTDIIYNNTSPTNNDESYRKHVAVSGTTTVAPFNWWLKTRELIKNSTHFKNQFNLNNTTNMRSQMKL